MAYRPPNQPGLASPSRAWGQNGVRNRFRERRREFNNWYFNIYPTWPGYGYPYGIDSGFYDWGEFDNATYEQGGAVPVYPAPFPEEGYGAPSQQPAAAGSPASSPPVPEQPLTVIFKNGRAPVKMQNYMMTTKVLTDLDSQHYEQIPLDQIDVAATQRVNSPAGVAFQIPGAPRN